MEVHDEGNGSSDAPSSPNELARIKQREQELREWLQVKPGNALLMAQLSDVLMQKSAAEARQSRQAAASVSSSCPWKIEALKWANQAIEQAPHRPFGYISLSFAADSISERMLALERAIDLTQQQQRQEVENGSNNRKFSSSSHISTAMLLARRLIEPRQEEIKQTLHDKNGPSIPRGDARHPSRRDLSPSELKLYESLQAALEEEWKFIHSQSTSVLPQTNALIKCLGKCEYRLGTCFRKMEPRQVHQPKSQRHFRRAFTELVTIHPSLAQEAQFWLATMSGGESSNNSEGNITVSRCPPEYIVGLYSTFAKRFDACLVQSLHYQTPTKLRLLVDQVVKASSSSCPGQHACPFPRALDLGCGTGLSGIAFTNCVKHMTGVDLSSEMLQKAQEKGCYHHVVRSDLVTFLQQQQTSGAAVHEHHESNKYELILAADVLVYLGDLTETLSGVSRLLSERGIFAGSTENFSEQMETSRSTNSGTGSTHQANKIGYMLQESGRFAHSQSYVERLADQVGLQIEQVEIAPIRKNSGKDIMGVLFVLSKK